MLWFTVFNTLSAFSGSYGTMLALRFLSGLPHGAFFGIGAVVAGSLVKANKASQAIAVMFSGLTVANVIGVPVGTYIGQTYHWSASFAMVGLVGVLTMIGVYLWIPKMDLGLGIPTVNGQTNKGLRNPELWMLIALTAIGTGGFFAWYSYIAPLITEVALLPDHLVGTVMVLAGLGMVLGNFLGAKMAEMFSPIKAVALSLSAMSVVLCLNSIFSTEGVVVIALAFVIGMISFTVATPIQLAIIQTAKGSEMLASSMNQSAFNIGNASGAFFAGLPIAYGHGVASAGYVGMVLAGLGVVVATVLMVYRKRQSRDKRKGVVLTG